MSNYSEEIDRIIYSEPVRSFTRRQYIDLAMAVLDQAGMKLRDQVIIREIIHRDTPEGFLSPETA